MPRCCPQCGKEWDDEFAFCPLDAVALPEPEEPPDPHLGAAVGEAYRIVELVDEGGMGVVYRAEHRRLESSAACKLLRKDRLGPEQLERFADEARIAAQARHPSVVRPFDYGRLEDDSPYLLMELLKGADLRRRLEDGPLDPAEAVRVVSTVAEAVAGLHADGIVHRDLKPSNVFLQDTGGAVPMVRLLDLGLARRLETDLRRTSPGMRLGTPLYMSPEQARGELQVGPPSDVFSLGAVLFEALTGTSPFEASTLRGVFARILTDDPGPASGRRPGLAPALDAVLQRALEKEPEARFPDAGALTEALRDLRGREGDAAAGAGGAARAPGASLLVPRRFVTMLLAEFLPPDVEDRTLDDGFLEGSWDELSGLFEEGICEAGGRVERLAGRTLLGVFQTEEGGGEAATALRTALDLCDRVEAHDTPLQAHVAVATTRLEAGWETQGRGGGGPLADVVDRASDLLAETRDPGVYVDAVTRERVLGRFDMVPVGPDDDAPFRVTKEKTHLDVLGVRRLFGRPVPLVGRQLELRQCSDVLDRVFHEGRPWFVSIVGPAGIGKSHLRHALDRVIEEDPRVVWRFAARGRPGRADDPFGLLAELLRRRVGAQAAEPPEQTRARLDPFLAEHLGAEAADVRPILWPLLAPDRATSQTTTGAGAAVEEAGQVSWALGRLLSAMAEKHPVWLVVEDGQWADRPSLACLEHLHDFFEGPLFAVLVARTELWERQPDLLAGRERHHRLDLRPLSRAEARTLLEAALGSFPSALEEWIWRRSVGVPQFIEALLWTLAERGILRSEAGGWTLTAPLSDDLLPPMIEGVLQARLEGLPPQARDVALRASVFGRRFWVEGVEAVGAREVAAALSELVRREIVHRLARSRVSGTDEYAFRHDVLQEAASAMVSPELRRELASLAGRWVEERLPHEPALAARLFERAERFDEAARALHRAVQRARRRGAAGRAASLVLRALELACRGEDDDLREALARIAVDAVWDAEDADACAQAERLLSRDAPATPGQQLLARWAGALRLLFLGRPRDAATRMRELLGPLADDLDHTWRIRALVEAARAARFGGDQRLVGVYVEEARRLAGTLGSGQAQAVVARGASLLATQPGGELLRLLEEAIETACAAQSPYLEAKARRNLAHAAVLLGHWERAQQEIERAVSLAEHHGWTRLHSVRVWLCIRRGQLREARVALARSRDFLQRLLADEGHERLYLDLLEAWLDTEEGAPDDLARAAARLERCAGHPGLGQSPRYRHIHLLRRACLLEAQQDPEAALAAVDEALGVYRESGALIEDTLLEQHVVLARLSAAAGRVPQARQAAEEGLGLAAEVADSLDEAWRRTFVTEAPEVAALLRHAAELGLEPPGALLAVRPSGGE